MAKKRLPTTRSVRLCCITLLNMPVTLTIHKRRDRTGNLYAARLVGRRLAVPQRYTEVEDDGDGFCFGAVVLSADAQRALIKFDYTGEREFWNLKLVKQWLRDDSGVDDLSAALSGL